MDRRPKAFGPGGVMRSRQLRKQMTDAERKMWFLLRDLKYPKAHFRRQVPMGPYFADFLSHHYKLVVEVDGGQHNEPINQRKDSQRESWFAREGFQTLRFWNADVLGNPEGVTDAILAALASRLPPPLTTPHKGEGQPE